MPQKKFPKIKIFIRPHSPMFDAVRRGDPGPKKGPQNFFPFAPVRPHSPGEWEELPGASHFLN